MKFCCLPAVCERKAFRRPVRSTLAATPAPTVSGICWNNLQSAFCWASRTYGSRALSMFVSLCLCVGVFVTLERATALELFPGWY